MTNLKQPQKALLVLFSLVLLVGIVSATTLPVYRFWDYKYGEGHLYTLSETEKNKILSNYSDVYTYEGVAFYAYKNSFCGTVPVYRFWNHKSGSDHLYTISESEKNKILSNYSDVYTYEGVAFYVYKDKTSCVGDDIAPAVALISPLNYAVFPEIPQSVNFIFSVFDQSNISSCGLKVNNIWINKSNVNLGLNSINVTLSKGIYTAEIYCTDAYDNTGKSNKVYFTILKGCEENETEENETSDTVAPMSVSGLGVASKTNDSILWNWTNPTDSDFAGTLIYINGENVANLSSTENFYNATGLQSNTSYTIVIYTKDSSGNVNDTEVSSTVRTLPFEEDDDEDDDEDTPSEKSKKKTSTEDTQVIFTSSKSPASPTNYTGGEQFLGSKTETKLRLGWLPYLLLILIILILVVLVLIIKNI